MSIGVCRVQKVSGAGNVTGCQIHNRREREHSNTNPDIDFTQSMNNFSLMEESKKPYNILIDERLKTAYKGKRAIRKDAVKMCEILFTSDTQFFEQLTPTEIKQYFQDCYNFACNRYGKENIISAIVHLDETTPHLHLDFVPLTSNGRLSAKEILGVKADLQKLQDDFYQKVSSKYGLERGNRADLENNEPTKKHLTTLEYKLKTTKDNLKKAENKLIQTEEQIKQSSEALRALQGEVLTQQQVNTLNGKKTLTGALKGISYEDYLSLKKTASTAEKRKDKINTLTTENNDLKEQIKQLQKDLQEAKTARFGYIMLQKNKQAMEIEEKYKKYIYREIPINAELVKNIQNKVCCQIVQNNGKYIIKCPFSEIALLDNLLNNLLKQKHKNNDISR